jgi:hypothetical protein
VLAAVLLAAVHAAPAATRVPTLERGTKTYRGSGSRALGALRLRRPARLSWRHPRGGRLRLLTGPRRFPLVSTTKRRGSVRLRPGTYRRLRVVTRGGWRLHITTLTAR